MENRPDRHDDLIVETLGNRAESTSQCVEPPPRSRSSGGVAAINAGPGAPLTSGHPPENEECVERSRRRGLCPSHDLGPFDRQLAIALDELLSRFCRGQQSLGLDRTMMMVEVRAIVADHDKMPSRRHCRGR